MSARDIVLQIAQVVTVLALAPLPQGVILQWEERVQRGRGPGIFQPTATCASCSASRSWSPKRLRGSTGAPPSSRSPA